MPQYAGFWRRFFASLLDMFLYSLVAGLLLAIMYGPEIAAEIRSGHGLGELNLGWLPTLVNNIIPVAATIVFWTRWGATPGKMLLGCRIVDQDTLRRITPGRAVLRYVGYFISALPLFLGFAAIGWDKRKQGFHDKIAKTVVIIEDESMLTTQELERGI